MNSGTKDKKKKIEKESDEDQDSDWDDYGHSKFLTIYSFNYLLGR